MDTTIQIAVVILIGVFLLYLVRLSSTSYQKKYGKRTLKQNAFAFVMFLLWCVLIIIGVWLHPLVGAVIFLVYFLGVIPIAKGKPDFWRDLRDTGFIAVFSALPLSYFAFYIQ